MMNGGNITPDVRWWRTITLQEDEGLWVHFSQSSFGVVRLARQWQFHATPEDPPNEPSTPSVVQVCAAQGSDFTMSQCLQRAFFDVLPESISLRPGLPERDVIARPAKPLMLLPGSRVTFYISLPLWLIAEHQQDHTPVTLIDRPIFRPSDTWFGSNTQSGRLAYASLTEARIHIEDLPLRAHRAVTPLHLRHHGHEAIPVSHFAIPAPRLSIFSDDDGMLWTEEVTMTVKDQTAEVSVDIQQKLDSRMQRIAAPRHSGMLVNWISSLDKWMGRLS